MAFEFKRFTDAELLAMTSEERDAYFRPLADDEIPDSLKEKIAQLGPPPATERRAG